MIKRLQIDDIKSLLFKGKVVIVYGARQVGKTSLSKRILEEYTQQNLNTRYFNCELQETQDILNTRSLAQLKAVMGIYNLVVLDEAQKIPDIGLLLKILVDNLPDTQIIATGSSSFELAGQVGEPLVGRSRQVLMFPISSLEIIETYDINYFRENIYQFVQYGMLPEVLSRDNARDKYDALEQITSAYLYRDLLALEDIRKPAIVEKIVKILAHQVGSEVSSSSIAQSLQVSPLTVDKYLNILEKAFIIYKLPPFSRNLQTEIKSKPKYYFYDTGVLNTLLENHNILDLADKYKGGVWENFVIMEKIKQNVLLKQNHQFYFWRNKGGAEVDLVTKTSKGLEISEIKFNETKHSRPPESFIKAYNPISYKTITPSTFWQEFVG